MPTDNHSYDTPTIGSTGDWGNDLNTNFEDMDIDVEIRDEDSNKSNYTPKSNAMFRATDTGAIYRGDGNNWNLMDIEVGSATFGSSVKSVISTDNEDRDIGVTNINNNFWGLRVSNSNSSLTQSVKLIANGTEVFRVNENQSFNLNTALDTSDETIQNNGGGKAVGIDAGIHHIQRGKPSTTELDQGNCATYCSDGSDAGSAGDLMYAVNDGGTIKTSIIAQRSNAT